MKQIEYVCTALYLLITSCSIINNEKSLFFLIINLVILAGTVSDIKFGEVTPVKRY